MSLLETDWEEIIPVDIGPQYEGERVRKDQYHVEFGGTKNPGFELVRAADGPDDVEDEKVSVQGPDLADLEEGTTTSLGVLIDVYIEPTEELNPKNLESVVERRHHEFCNYIHGFMHLNQRSDVWMRLDKSAYRNGVDSLEKIGRAVMKMYKTEQTFIDKIQITYFTRKEDVEERLRNAHEVWAARDERVRGLHEEDVDKFYGCVLCQSFAPDHCCIITPDRISLCGALTYLDTQAAATVDPEGPYFEVDKGELVNEKDPAREFTGANEAVREKTNGANERFRLHTIFDYVHTSCGCFEGAYFYIPEVDGIGFIHRNFEGETPLGIPFSTMAGSIGGGQQSYGFLGGAIEYFRSSKFLQADGGWRRMVWIPEEIKEEVKPELEKAGLYDKIVTEKDTRNVNELREILRKRNHPIVTRWVDVTDELVKKTIAYIKEKRGRVSPTEASRSLGLNQVQFRKVVDEMKQRGVLAGEPGGYMDDLDYRWGRGELEGVSF
jgi:acetyl-CoA decarbonylase/synthase complex subunit beta